MLDGFFKPNAVVVVGASRDETKVGFSIVLNLVRGGFPGPIYPVNPKATEILGVTCYPDGARGGQPLNAVKYSTAVKHIGEVMVEQADVCDISKGGSCGA